MPIPTVIPITSAAIVAFLLAGVSPMLASMLIGAWTTAWLLQHNARGPHR